MSGAPLTINQEGYCDAVQLGVTSAFKTGAAGRTEAGSPGL
jgi:hypothetical protein